MKYCDNQERILRYLSKIEDSGITEAHHKCMDDKHSKVDPDKLKDLFVNVYHDMTNEEFDVAVKELREEKFVNKTEFKATSKGIAEYKKTYQEYINSNEYKTNQINK